LAGEQTVRNALAVWNELGADRHGVAYARIVIILVLGARRRGRKLKHKAKSGKSCGVMEGHSHLR
jgi:hypothetical protein